MENVKYMNDPIHGHIPLDSTQLAFIDTEHFQRLRDLKQLGTAYYVFPGACHNRFEHSIGVSYLCERMLKQLKLNGAASGLDLREEDEMCVKIAGLCHDLGHGPYSHVFDNEFIPRARPNVKWCHEDASKMLLENLIDSYNLDIDQEHIRFIQSLIEGDANSYQKEKGWLFDIVANKRNSVDVDKFDYISRDCYYSGAKNSYDFDRIINFSKVVGNEICFSAKEAYNLYEMFHTRYTLFKKVYTHKVTKAIEYMIVDAMVLAEPVLHMSEMIYDPGQYIYLTDSILREIERSQDPRLQASRDIMKRIRDRDIYKFVDEYHYGQEESKFIGKEKSAEIAAKIFTYRSNSGTGQDSFSPDDVIVEILKVNYAMKDKNPVDSIRFYSKYGHSNNQHLQQQQQQQQASPIGREKISALIPEHYQDTVCRVFSKSPTKVKEIQEAFRAYLSQESHLRSAATKAILSTRKRTSTFNSNDDTLEDEDDNVLVVKSPPWNTSLTIPRDFTASPRKRVLPPSMNTSPVKK